MATAGDLVVNLTANSQKFTGGLQQAQGGISSFVSGAVAKFSAFGLAMAGVQAAGRLLGKLQMPLELAANAEQTEVAFSTMLGSADKAREVLANLEKMGASTPFQTEELNDAGRKLLAFGTNADDLVPTLTAIGDVASGVQAPIGEIAEIFGKAQVAGTLFSEDINQLVGRGIPVIQEFAKQLGVSEGQVKKLASEGKISFSHLQQAFADMTGEGGKFSGMMAAQSATTMGLFSTLKDNATSILKGIGQVIIDAFNIKGGMEGAIAAIGPLKDRLLSTIQSWVPTIQAFVETVKSKLIAGFTVARDFAVKAWDAIGTPVLAYVGMVKAELSALWQMMQEGFGAISEFVTAAWTQIFGGGEGFKSFTDLVTEGLLMMEFGWRNWKTLIELATVSAMLQVVTFGNEVEHLFMGVIPALLTWFGDNWKNVFLDLFEFTTTVMGNINGNIVNILANLPGLIKGTVKFDQLWAPLTAGFESAIKELPDIPDRVMGDLEKSLSDDVQRMGGNVGDDFAKFRDERMKEIAGSQKQIGELLKTSVALTPAAAAAGEKPRTLADVAANAPKTEGKPEKAPGFAQALRSGSSEAFSAILAAMRAGRDGGKNPAEQQVEEQKKTNELLEDIARKEGLAGGGFTVVENFA